MHHGIDLFQRAQALDEEGDDPRGAVDLYREAIAAGLDDETLKLAWRSIAFICEDDHPEEAMDAYLNVIERCEANGSVDVVGYYELAGDLAAVMGDPAALASFYERSIARQQQEHGSATHAAIIRSYADWAKTLRQVGDEDGAQDVEQRVGALLDEALEDALKAQPEPATVTLEAIGLALERPAGFADAPLHPGFVCEAVQAFIIAQRVPVPLADQVEQLVDEAGLKQRFMQLLGRTEGPLGPLVCLSQLSPIGEVVGWNALIPTDDGQGTLVLSAKAPAALWSRLEQPLLGCLRSATLLDEAGVARDPLVGLDFTVQAPAGLKLGGRVGDALLFNRHGDTRVLAPGEPLLVVAASIAPAPLDDEEARERFARDRVRREVGDLIDTRVEHILVSHRPAVRLRTTGYDDDVHVDVAAVVVFDHHRYWFALATAHDPDVVDQMEQALQSLHVGVAG